MNMFFRIVMLVASVLFINVATAQLKVQAPSKTPAATTKSIPLPESVPQLQRFGGMAYEQKKYRAFVKIMEKLHQLRPLNTGYMYQLALAYALVDNKSAAYNQMLKLQQQGASYDFSSTEDSNNIRGTEVYDYLNKMLIQAGEPIGAVETMFTLDRSVVLPEAIDWDPVNEVFLLGTVSDGKILRLDMEGKTSTLFQANADNGMWSIYDIKVDESRGIFWVSTAAVRSYKGYQQHDYGRSALFKFDLKSGKLLERLPMELDGNPHLFANIALADDGSVYVADSQVPVIYVLKPGAKSAKIFLVASDLLSIRSLVFNKDNSYLYLSDYSKGLFIVNMATGQLRAPLMEDTLNTSGIDGMYRWKDSLVVIQNGFHPSRVLRLQLNEKGTEIIDMAPLAVAQALFDKPNFGVIRDNSLYFYANSHWGLVDTNGEVSTPIKIIRTRVDEAPNLTNPDIEMYYEHIKNMNATEPKTGGAERK